MPRLIAALFAAALLCAPIAGASDSTFRFRLPVDPSTLDWTSAATNFETYVLMNIMEGLVEIDNRLSPVPALAESWTTSTDGLTYTFHLRKNVKWTDGVPLAAKDFITSWRRLLAPGSRNDYAAFLFDIDGAEDFHSGRFKDFSKVNVHALDDATLQVKLRRIVPYFVSLLSFWVTFPQREDLVKKKGWDEPGRLVTLGPYRLTKWVHGAEIDFERNPTYYGTAPSVEHVVAVIEPDKEKTRKLFDEGKVDVLLNVDTQDLVALSGAQTENNRRLRQFDYIASVFLAFNTVSAPFVNIGLRRAVAHGIDRSGLQAALKGGQVAADSLIPRGIAGYEPLALLTSPDQARSSMAAAGYKSPADVPALTLTYIERQQQAAAEYLRDTLRRTLELNVDLKPLSHENYLKARRAGHFEMVVVQWGADYPDGASFMELFSSDAHVIETGWKNKRYDTLVKTGARSLKMLERMKAYSEAQRLLLQENVVIVPLYYPKITALLSAKLENLEITPLNYLFFKRITLK